MSSQDSPLSLGTDSISKLLFRYAMPAIIAQVAASLYNIVDSIFVGQGVGPLAITGLALTMPMMNLSAAFGAMVGAGSAALTSIRLGQGNKAAAENILGNVVLLNVVLGMAIMVFGLVYIDELLYFFGASDQTLPYAREYMRIILYGNTITHLFHGLNNMLRVAGYPNKAMTITIISVMLNAVLDALFILGLDWGIAGSAWATVLSQTVSLVLLFAHFMRRDSFLRFHREAFHFHWDLVKGITTIGMAPFMIQTCACVVVILVNTTLQRYGGDLSIGAYGIANRVAFLFTMVVLGFTQGMQPIVGYNYGARKYDRALKTMWLTVGWSVATTTLGFLVCEIFPHQVVGMFVSEDGSGDATALIDASVKGLRILVAMLPIVGFNIVAGNFFQHIGKPKRAILLSVSRQMLFIVPLLFFLPPIYGVDGVWYAIPIADFVSTALAAVLLLLQIRKLRQNPSSEVSI
ncbi:MAG: MATE family efflux transporter [Alistipes sp.]|nr:MATE family efflux transporter [Alistipes sp.]MBR2072223.1 MATE family efflux transporter [Alistipes sp.]